MADEERASLSKTAEQLTADLAASTTERKRLDDLLGEMRRRMEEATRRADAGSDEKLQHDNSVLRGIVARQNTELEIRHRDIVRLRRKRFGLQIVYALFALGLLALGYWAMQVLPSGWDFKF